MPETLELADTKDFTVVNIGEHFNMAMDVEWDPIGMHVITAVSMLGHKVCFSY